MAPHAALGRCSRHTRANVARVECRRSERVHDGVEASVECVAHDRTRCVRGSCFVIASTRPTGIARARPPHSARRRPQRSWLFIPRVEPFPAVEHSCSCSWDRAAGSKALGPSRTQGESSGLSLCAPAARRTSRRENRMSSHTGRLHGTARKQHSRKTDEPDDVDLDPSVSRPRPWLMLGERAARGASAIGPRWDRLT